MVPNEKNLREQNVPQDEQDQEPVNGLLNEETDETTDELPLEDDEEEEEEEEEGDEIEEEEIDEDEIETPVSNHKEADNNNQFERNEDRGI